MLVHEANYTNACQIRPRSCTSGLSQFGFVTGLRTVTFSDLVISLGNKTQRGPAVGRPFGCESCMDHYFVWEGLGLRSHSVLPAWHTGPQLSLPNIKGSMLPQR